MLNRKEVSLADTCAYLLHCWKPFRHRAFAALFLMICAVIIDAVTPLFTGRMIDAMMHSNSGAASQVWSAFVLFTAFSLLNQVLRFVGQRIWHSFSPSSLYSVATEGLDNVQKFSAEWHANHFAGSTVRGLTRGMSALDLLQETLLMGIVPTTIIIVSVTTVLTIKMPLVGGIAACMALTYGALNIWVATKVLAPRYGLVAEHDSRLGGALSDILSGNATVKAFAAEARESIFFRSLAGAWRDVFRSTLIVDVKSDSLQSLFRLLTTSVVLGTALWMWQEGTMTPGDAVFVLTSLLTLSGYLRNIGQHIVRLQKAVSDMQDVVGYWREAMCTVVEEWDALPLTLAANSLERVVFENVSFQYPSGGEKIYDGIHLTIRHEERLALVGMSGSGKSTFVKLLQRLYDVSDGTIQIDGQDIRQVTLSSLRRSIALVPQDPVLFHRSIAENIAYGRPGVKLEEIVDAAKKAYAHDFIMRLPEGYDTLVGERGVKLSGGERQRVAIARALLADAPILVFDEATSSLDTVSERAVQQALDNLMKGRTTITIAHRLSTIQGADRIVVFEDGQIVEEGTHAALLSTSSRYRKFYNLQSDQESFLLKGT